MQEFLGLHLLTAPDVLVPRAETELLARETIDRVRLHKRNGELRLIDMCCGAGNLACAVAMRLPQARVWACDLTGPSVDLCRANVEQLELTHRVSVHQGDLFAALADDAVEASFDAVVCNPPYISQSRLYHGDRRSLLEHEPSEAFDGGPFGLSIHQRLLRESPRLLRDGGLLLFEFGAGQDVQIRRLFSRSSEFEHVAIAHDENDVPRVAMAQRRLRLDAPPTSASAPL